MQLVELDVSRNGKKAPIPLRLSLCLSDAGDMINNHEYIKVIEVLFLAVVLKEGARNLNFILAYLALD